MTVINLFGGPCVGKSTLAAQLFSLFKIAGYRTELSREQAKELLYQGRTLADCQMLISALQYQHLKDLEKSGTEIAICDGPMLQGAVYAGGLPYAHELTALLVRLSGEFRNINVQVNRAVPFDSHGRTQAREEDARVLDAEVAKLCRPHLVLETPDADVAFNCIRVRL